ncbi:MAG TPA: hypothetical protein VLA16_18795 [Ideonella sp.]|nr:hypothetical protein [Ideonella sp.]
MRRWFSSLLLACLLVSQQGGLLHGLGHALAALGSGHAPAATALADIGQPPPTDEACSLCEAFVQLAGAVTPTVAPPSLLAGLSHALVPVAPLPAGTASLPAQRSRGPPAAT